MSEIKKLSVEAIQDVENIIGYTFTNKELLNQAFTRSTYANENKEAVSNEILEFYGDRAIEQVVAKTFQGIFGYIDEKGRYVSKHFPGQVQKIDEGFLSILKSEFVRKSSLATRMTELNLSKYLICGGSDNSEDLPDSIKEDLFESICGAMAIDSCWNYDIISNPISSMLNLENLLNDFYKVPSYISTFSQWYFNKFNEYPIFHYDNFIGNSFECFVYIKCNIKNYGYHGTGKTMIEARNEAIREAYKDLFEKGNRFQLFEDELEKVFKKTWLNPTLSNSINIVQEMEQSGLLRKVQYTFKQSKNDNNGDPLWECSISYENDFVTNAKCTCTYGKSKIEIKKHAALFLLDTIFEQFNIKKFVSITE